MQSLRPRAWAFDMWGVGVTWLELTLATPQVRVSGAARASEAKGREGASAAALLWEHRRTPRSAAVPASTPHRAPRPRPQRACCRALCAPHEPWDEP
jgi:hypothetical protein